MATKPGYATFAADAAIIASTLNSNFETFASAIRACLGRDGTDGSPNSMYGDLDMDGHAILNVSGIGGAFGNIDFDAITVAAESIIDLPDQVQTAEDAVAATTANLALTNADVSLTHADVQSTNADVVTCSGYVSDCSGFASDAEDARDEAVAAVSFISNEYDWGTITEIAGETLDYGSVV